MPRRKTTFKTSSQVTRNIKPKRRADARIALCAAALLLAAAAPSAEPATLHAILSAHLDALAALHVHPPRTFHERGTIEGLGLRGTFETWRDGEDQRYDETLGIRAQRTLRLGDVQYVQNANGDVRVLRGLAARRQLTEDFIDSGEFARHPEDVTLLGRATLGGRSVWQMRVAPTGGEPYGVSLDAASSMVVEKAYQDGDGIATMDYSDYRVVDGALVAYVEVDSNGDRRFDVTSRVESARANETIDPSVFAALHSVTVENATPVTVPLLSDHGHLFVRADAGGKPLVMLVDTGSQGIFIDPAASARLGLTPQGTLEVRGLKRTQGLGVAALPAIDVGSARLPVGVVSVLDLTAVTYRGVTIDGVLGYPFFAAAEVRIDPEKLAMTIGKPGSLPALGSPVKIDTDRELPEMTAKLYNVEGRFLVVTGNTNDLLVFHDFVAAHPGVVFYGRATGFATNGGVGGSSAAVPAVVNALDLGPFKLYNRYADVMLNDTGVFADRNDAGNIGFGTLSNFVCTFDLASATLYLAKTRWFDDGRYRALSPSTSRRLPP
jgi:hypothetical protein